MRLFRAFLAAALVLVLAPAAGLAQTTTTLVIRDGSGTSQNNCAYTISSLLAECHVQLVYDGSSWHVARSDTSGDMLVAGLGTAGTPSGGVVSVQGVSGGVAQPVSAASGGLASGAVVDLTNIETTAGGSAPSKAASVQGIAGGTPVAVPFSRTVTVTATFTPGTSYSVGNAVSTPQTLAVGVGNGVPVRMNAVTLFCPAAAFVAAASLEVHFFNAAPNTTFTDGSTPTWSASDNTVWENETALSVLSTTQGTGVQTDATNAAYPGTLPLVTGSDGSIRVQNISTGTWTITTPGACKENFTFTY